MRTSIIFICILLSCNFHGCKEKEEEKIVNFPVLGIDVPILVKTSSFSVDAEVTDNGGGTISERGICYGTGAWPDITNSKVTAGTGDGKFTCNVTGLVKDTRYYLRAYAINEAGAEYSQERIVVTSNEEVTDFEGNKYGAVKIGQQVWLRENLKSKKYSDGASISQVFPAGGDESKVEVHGRLYTWYAVMRGAKSTNSNPGTVQGVCPTGYHVPSDAEWMELEMSQGMSQSDADWVYLRGNIGGKLKTGNLWQPSPGLNDNSSGFSAIPAGWRTPEGVYNTDAFSFWGCYHTTTEANDTTKSFERLLIGDGPGIWKVTDKKGFGLSVRCVKNK